MSDMRAKYVVLSSVAFAFGIIGALMFAPAFSTVSATQLNDSIPWVIGHIEFTVVDADGNLKHYQQTDNVVTDKGLECAIRNLFGTSTTTGTAKCTSPNTAGTFNNIALGDDGTTALVGDTGLAGTEVARKVADTQNWTVATEKLTLVLSCVADTDCGLIDGETVAETGLFDSETAGAGNMLARQGLNSVTVTTGDTVTITWNIDADNT